MHREKQFLGKKERTLGREDVLLSLASKKSRKFEALCRVLGLRDASGVKKLREILAGLEEEGRVSCSGGRWSSAKSSIELTGTYVPLPTGIAIIRCDDNENGVKTVEEEDCNPALIPGDTVAVSVALDSILLSQHHGSHPHGRITRIVQENRKPFPAVLHIIHARGGVRLKAVPLNPACRGSYPVSGVPEDVHDGDTILVRSTERDIMERRCEVEFVKSCGAMDTIAMQEKLVKINHLVPAEFPPAVLEQVESLVPEPSEEDMAGRRDLRDLPFVTIDGDTARDFDDAVEVERLGEGKFLLRVAIADVSHYVRTGSPMDREAQDRGNSWYFPTSVEPMLPKELSNGLCSLNPGVNRLVMWAEIPFDAGGRPGKAAFGTGVIRSFGRLTYDGVRDVLLLHDAAAEERFRETVREPARVLAMLGVALELYRILREARIRRGSLDFDLPETEAVFDENGHVLNLFRAERHDIHRLIEEFMIAANEAVARRLEETGTDFLYRVHPAPAKEKLLALYGALNATRGTQPVRMKGGPDIGAIIAQAKGREQEYAVNRLCVRVMAQALYSRHNEGHFGLASDAYCHFTSPIRRYADLLVHRALKHALGIDGGAFPVGERLDRVADVLNRRERQSMECEREMNRRLACLWMARQDREKAWQGTVSAVMSFGVFVELSKVPVEGLIPMEALGFGANMGDWFEYDPYHQVIIGEVTHFTWRVGLSVTVQCPRVDVVALQIDFSPLEVGRGQRRKNQSGKEKRSAGRPKKKATGPGIFRETVRPAKEHARSRKSAGHHSRPAGKARSARTRNSYPSVRSSEVEDIVRAIFGGGEK